MQDLLNKIREQLKDRRLCVIQKETGIHASTLARIRDGDTDNPTWATMQKLKEYFEL